MWTEWYLFVETVRKKYLKYKYKTKYTCIGRDEQWNNKLDDFSEKQKKCLPVLLFIMFMLLWQSTGEELGKLLPI